MRIILVSISVLFMSLWWSTSVSLAQPRNGTLPTQKAVGRDRTLSGHSKVVNALAFSPDSKRLLTGSADNTAILWDALSGQALLTLKGSTSKTTSMLFSPDGKRLIAGSADGSTRIWDAAKGEQIQLLTNPGAKVASIEISDDGTKLVIGYEGGQVKLWDSTTGQCLTTVSSDGVLFSTLVYSDGSWIAAGYMNSVAKVWDAKTGSLIRTIALNSTGSVIALQYIDAQTLLTWDRADSKEQKAEILTVTQWDLKMGMKAASVSFPMPENTIVLDFSMKTNRMIFGLLQGDLVIYYLPKGQGDIVPIQFHAHEGIIAAVTLSPDGALAASSGTRNGQVKIWDIKAHQPAAKTK